MAILFSPRATTRPTINQLAVGNYAPQAGTIGAPGSSLNKAGYLGRNGARQLPNGSWVDATGMPLVGKSASTQPIGTGSHASYGARGGSTAVPTVTQANASVATPATPAAQASPGLAQQPTTSTAPPPTSGFGTSSSGGLASMGIPAPTPSAPRPAFTPIPMPPQGNYNPTNGTGTAAGNANGLGAPNPNYGGYYNYQDFHNDTTNKINKYTGGVMYTSNPVTPGSATNGGIGGPSAVAALNSWQLGQNEAQYRQAFGDRGPQFALNDYYPGSPANGPQYIGGSLAAQNQALARAPSTPAPTAAAAATTPATPTTGSGAAPYTATPAAAQAATTSGAPAATATTTTAAGASPAYQTYSGGSSPGYSGYGVDPNAQAVYNNNLLNQFAGDVSSQQEAARAANEQRYGDILTGRGAQYDREMGMLNGMGDYTRGQINLSAQRAVAANTQKALDSGLGGSTIMPSLQNQTYFERNQNLGSLDQQLREQALGVDQRVTEGTLATMENRTDQAPSTESLMQLAMSLGQAGNGGYLPQVQNPQYQTQNIGGSVPYNGAIMGIDYVSNGMDGGAYGQQVGTYTTKAEQQQQMYQQQMQAQQQYMMMQLMMQQAGMI